MALPTIPKKVFEYKSKFVPKGKLNLVPFSVGQEAVLLQVKDSESFREQLSALRQVIQECLQTPNIDVERLPLFVVEELFLRLREHSVSELIEMVYRCTNDIDGKPCNNKLDVNVDIREMKIKEYEGHTNKIMIDEPIGIQMKYPDIDLYERYTDAELENELDLVVACIDLIFDEDNVYTRDDATDEEFTEFWKQLTIAQKRHVYDKFWVTTPHLHYKQDFVCSKCGHLHEIEFNSLAEVF